jgi:hypothetical protein
MRGRQGLVQSKTDRLDDDDVPMKAKLTLVSLAPQALPGMPVKPPGQLSKSKAFEFA